VAPLPTSTAGSVSVASFQTVPKQQQQQELHDASPTAKLLLACQLPTVISFSLPGRTFYFHLRLNFPSTFEVHAQMKRYHFNK
jgi:hypothetical protein